MTIQELYRAIEGNYEEAMNRMLKEERAAKYITMFLEDTCYEELLSAIAEERVEDAFRAAHNMKGVTANLAFTRLHDSAVLVTEELRGGKDFEKAKEYMPMLVADYELTVSNIREFAK